MNTKNILVLKVGALGDIVDSSTMIPVLRAKYPQSRITWICGAEFVELVEHFGVDQVLPVNRHLLTGSFFQKARFSLSIIKKILFKRYDLCIVGQTGNNYKMLAYFSLSKKISSFGKRNGPISGRYRGDEYARLATGKDDFFTNYAELSKIDISPLSNNSVLLLPGGAYYVAPYDGIRRWPIEKFVRLARTLTDNNINVSLIGEPRDIWAEKYFDGIPVTSYIGKTTVLELIALLKGCKALVGHDSGPLHLALFADCPIVGLFGPTLYRDFLPVSRKIIPLHTGIPCSPCYDGTLFAKCTSNRCMQEITVQSVLNSLKLLLTD